MRILITAFITIISSHLMAQISTESTPDWTYVTAQLKHNNDTCLVYIKPTCIYSDNGIIKIWSKEYSQIKEVNNNYYENEISMTLFLFNCRTQEMKILTVVEYDQNGNKLYDSEIGNDPNNNWQNIIPETVGDKLINKACELFNK